MVLVASAWNCLEAQGTWVPTNVFQALAGLMKAFKEASGHRRGTRTCPHVRRRIPKPSYLPPAKLQQAGEHLATPTWVHMLPAAFYMVVSVLLLPL